MTIKNTKNKAKYKIIYLVIILISIIVRLSYCIKYPVPIRDSYKYIDFLKNRNVFEVSDKPYPPLALRILQIPNNFFGIDLYKEGVGINCACGILIVILLGEIIGIITKSAGIKFVGMLFASTHPTLVDLSCHFSRDNIFFLFLILTFYLFLKSNTQKKGIYLLYAGISTGSCILSRHEGIELLFIFMIWKAFDSFKQKTSFFILFRECIIFFVSTIISIIIILKVINISPQ